MVGRGSLPRWWRDTGDYSTDNQTESCEQDNPLRLHVDYLDAGSVAMASIP
jgi:hypothetical protein